MGFTIYHRDVKQAYTKAKLDCKIVMNFQVDVMNYLAST